MIRLVDINSVVISIHNDLKVALFEMERLIESGDHEVILVERMT
jgi:hypothetical protein